MEVSARELSKFFRLQGRCYVSDERLFLNASGGSVQGTFQGDFLRFTVFSDYGERGRNAYLRLTTDGRTKRIRLPKGEKTISVTLPAGRHDFELVKLTESTNNSFGVKCVTTDGEFLPPAPKERKRIEFIGDSITTGFGVLAKETYGEYKTKEQDFTKAFPYIVTKALDADYHVVAAGGWPIYKSKYASYAIPDYYENVDLLRNAAKADLAEFTPDVVVVTLGTNDFSYLADLSPEAALEERGKVKSRFLAFLRRLSALYPRARIVLFYGFFEYPDLGVLTEEVAAELMDPRITTVRTVSAASIGDVRAGHPGKRSHAQAAKTLLAALKK